MQVPEKQQICTSSKIQVGIDLFMCGLCNYLVTPGKLDKSEAPLQCCQCHSLFCEWCVNSQMMWQCPNPACKTKD